MLVRDSPGVRLPLIEDRNNPSLISYSFIGDVIIGIFVGGQQIIDLMRDFVIQYATERMVSFFMILI